MNQDSQPEIEGLIERVTAFAVHAQRMYDNGGSLIFCSGKTLRPGDLSALLSLKEGGGLASCTDSAASVASQPDCSAAQHSDGPSDLDRAWRAVDALGGTFDPKDERAAGYDEALGLAIAEIEKLGGKWS